MENRYCIKKQGCFFENMPYGEETCNYIFLEVFPPIILFENETGQRIVLDKPIFLCCLYRQNGKELSIFHTYLLKKYFENTTQGFHSNCFTNAVCGHRIQFFSLDKALRTVVEWVLTSFWDIETIEWLLEKEKEND